MKNLIKTNYFYFILYLIIFILVLFFRNQLDKETIFISSDGQIKYYQSVHFYKNSLNFECLYPSKKLDPIFEYFIFDYPWAYFNILNEKCIFQYPSLFSLIGSLFLFLSEKAPLYFPLFFLFINLIFFHCLLVKIGLNRLWSFSTVLIGFLFSFPLLSVIDYSEMSFYHFFLLVSFLLFYLFIQEKKPSLQKRYAFLWSFSIFFAFYIRMEAVLLGLSFLLSMLFFLELKFVFQFTFSFFLGGIVCFLLFSLFYLFSIGYFLDVRSFTIIEYSQDMAFDMKEKLYIFKSFLYKISEKRGIFYAFPLFYSFPFFLFLLKKKDFPVYSKIVFLSGVLCIFLTSWTSHDIGGVQNFGLRYLDAGFFSFLIGISSFLFFSFSKIKKLYQIIVLFLLFLFLIPTIQFTKNGLKTLWNSSFYYSKMQKYLNEIQEGYVLHLNLSTVYLVGYSYLKQKHLFPKGKKHLEQLLEKFEKNDVEQFIILRNQHQEKPIQSVPKWQYEKFLYDPKISLDSPYKKEKEVQLLSYTLEFYKK